MFDINPYVRLGIDCGSYVLVLLITVIFIRKNFVRSRVILPLCGLALVSVAASVFDLTLLRCICFVCLAALLVAVVVANEQKVNIMLKRKDSLKDKGAGSLERKKLYKVINDAVNYLSTTRTGAIMTFEKNDSLEDYINKGVRVDAPVTKELLATIFYEGTMLHDGAVIIRDNTIVAAACFYIPTVKPMNGKYGARHRASLGISEVCDAVTIVVSEETGRISLAIGGELLAVTRENFLKVFKAELEK